MKTDSEPSKNTINKNQFKKQVKAALKEMIQDGDIQIQLAVEELHGENIDKYQVINLNIIFDDDTIDTNGQIWINKI